MCFIADKVECIQGRGGLLSHAHYLGSVDVIPMAVCLVPFPLKAVAYPAL